MGSREIDFRVIYTSAHETDEQIPADLLVGKEWTSTRFVSHMDITGVSVNKPLPPKGKPTGLNFGKNMVDAPNRLGLRN
jgi:hypothetical protein